MEIDRDAVTAARCLPTLGNMPDATTHDVLVRRGLRTTMGTTIGVAAVATSTVAMLQKTDPHPSRVLFWAIVFFACAQVSAACLGLAAVRAAALRYQVVAQPRDVDVLDRRNALALGFALMAQFAAAAALPGHAPAWLVLGGPMVALISLVLVARTHAWVRRLDQGEAQGAFAPWIDIMTLVRRSPAPETSTWKSQGLLLTLTTGAGVVGAFVWDQLDQGTIESSRAAALTEAAFILAGFVLLGPALGLWSAQRSTRPGSTRRRALRLSRRPWARP